MSDNIELLSPTSARSEVPEGETQPKEEKKGFARIQEIVGETIEKDAIQFALIGLLLIDVLCIVVESFLDLDYTLFATADNAGKEGAEEAEEAIGHTSFLILFVFLSENLLLMFSLGPKTFFSNPGFIVDLLVIGLSIASDMFLEGAKSARLLLILRLWRVARIIHGFYVLNEKENTKNKEKYERIIAKKEARREKLEKHVELSPPGELKKCQEERDKLEEAAEAENETQGCAKWRFQAVEFIEQPSFQILTVVLLLIDMTCVILEIIVSHNAVDLGFEGYVPANSTTGLMVPTEKGEEGAEVMEKFLSATSVSILFFFEIEVLTMAWGLGPVKFAQNPGEMADFFVITFSLVCDLFLEGNQSVLVVLRLWRIARLIHGLYMINVKKNELNVKKFKKEIIKNDAYCSILEKQIIRNLLDKASNEEVQKRKDELEKSGILKEMEADAAKAEEFGEKWKKDKEDERKKEEEEEMVHLTGFDKFRYELVEKVENERVQFVMVGLLLIDVGFTIVETFMDLDASLFGFESVENKEGGYDLTEAGEETAEESEEAIGTTSTLILFIFLTENMLMFIGLGVKKFCTTPGFVLDFVVITVSISCAVFLEGSHSATLLVVLRLWRIARIIHGFYLLNEKEEKENKEKFEAEMKIKDDAIKKFEERLPTQDREEFEMLTRVLAEKIKEDNERKALEDLPVGPELDKFRMKEAIESPSFQVFTVSLLLIDMTCVVVSILIEHGTLGPEEKTESFAQVLEALSIGILSFFQIEVLTMLWAMGPVEFFHSPGEVLDLFVVTISLTFDLLEATEAIEPSAVSSLMLVMRLWRIGRLVHGLYMINEKQNKVQQETYSRRLKNKKELIEVLEDKTALLEAAVDAEQKLSKVKG